MRSSISALVLIGAVAMAGRARAAEDADAAIEGWSLGPGLGVVTMGEAGSGVGANLTLLYEWERFAVGASAGFGYVASTLTADETGYTAGYGGVAVEGRWFLLSGSIGPYLGTGLAHRSLTYAYQVATDGSEEAEMAWAEDSWRFDDTVAAAILEAGVEVNRDGSTRVALAVRAELPLSAMKDQHGRSRYVAPVTVGASLLF